MTFITTSTVKLCQSIIVMTSQRDNTMRHDNALPVTCHSRCASHPTMHVSYRSKTYTWNDVILVKRSMIRVLGISFLIYVFLIYAHFLTQIGRKTRTNCTSFVVASLCLLMTFVLSQFFVSCNWAAIFFPVTEYFHNGPTVFCCHKLLTVGRQLQKHAHVAPKFRQP